MPALRLQTVDSETGTEVSGRLCLWNVYPPAPSYLLFFLIASLALGAVILSCCTALPWIGWIVLVAASVVGLGAFLVRD